MGLKEEIEKIKGEIGVAEKTEQEAPEEVVEETFEPEEKPEEKVEEKPEEPKEEPKKDEPVEEKQDNAAMAKMRRTAAAAEKRAQDAEARRVEAEAKLAALHAPTEEVEATPEAPVNPEIEELIHKQRMSKAESEFETFEEKVKAVDPEYADISKEYSLALAQSIRLQNPRMSAKDIAEKTKLTIMEKAANYMKEGFENPVLELFHEAKELGFTGASMKKKEEPVAEIKEEPKPDMKKLAANRAKSSGMTSTGGKSEGQMTKAYAATELTNDEWMRLPKAEKQRILAS